MFSSVFLLWSLICASRTGTLAGRGNFVCKSIFSGFLHQNHRALENQSQNAGAGLGRLFRLLSVYSLKKQNKPLQTLKRSESVFSFARVYLDAVS